MNGNNEFFHAGDDISRCLYKPGIDSDERSSSCLTPEDVDSEMASGKNSVELEICGMNQESFEHFAKRYGKTYRSLSFFKCQLIHDFSPLEDMPELENISIYWNVRATGLWNLSKNRNLKTLSISDARKLTLKPDMLHTSGSLKTVNFAGDIFNKYSMESLDCFAGMQSLESIGLYEIKLLDKRLGALETLPNLKEFNFDPSMLTTEEIALICAKYPGLRGDALGVCSRTSPESSFVRVCGFRKPELDLREEKDRERLKKYAKQFEMLVEKFKN